MSTLSADHQMYSFSHQLFHESIYGFCMTAMQRRAVHGAFSAAAIALSIEYAVSPNGGGSFVRRDVDASPLLRPPTATRVDEDDCGAQSMSIHHLAWLGDQLENSGRPLLAWPLFFAASRHAVSAGAYQEGLQLALTALDITQEARAARVTIGKVHTEIAWLLYAKLGMFGAAAHHALLGVENVTDGTLRVPTCTSTLKLFLELSNFFFKKEMGSALADSTALSRLSPDIRRLVARCWMVLCNVLSDDWVRRMFKLSNARAVRNQRYYLRLRAITMTQSNPQSTMHIFGLAMMSRSHQIGTTLMRMLADESMNRATRLLANADMSSSSSDWAKKEALAHLGLSQGTIHLCEGDMCAMEASFNRTLELFESNKNVTFALYTATLLGMVRMGRGLLGEGSAAAARRGARRRCSQSAHS